MGNNMWMYQGQGLGAGVAQMADAIYGRRDAQAQEEKQRAREFTSLQNYADAAGIVPKTQSTPMDLETLRGVVSGYHAKQALEKEGLSLEDIRGVIAARQQQMSQQAALAPEQLAALQQANAYHAAMQPLQLQSMQQSVAEQGANMDATSAARAAIPEFMQRLQAHMNPEVRPPLAPRSVPLGEALPAALADVPAVVGSPQGVNLLNGLDRLAPRRDAIAPQKPQLIDLGNGTQVIWSPTTGAVRELEKAKPGTIRVTTGNSAPGQQVVTRNMTAEEYAAWQGDQAAAAAARSTMEPAVQDAWQKYMAAQQEIAKGNRYVGPEASWLPSFGDRATTTAAEGKRLQQLTGRPPDQWTQQQHAAMQANDYVPPPPAGKIVVLAPNGARAYLPKNQWPEAQKQGFIQLPFNDPGAVK